jgi:hypothetical protein
MSEKSFALRRITAGPICRGIPTKIRRVPLPLAQPPAHERTSDLKQSAIRPIDAPRPLAFWHLASLDAPTVAIVWSLAFAKAAGIHLPAWVPLLLALATWSVYVGDRLLDTRAGMRSPSLHALRERHYFHWRFRRVLLPLAVVAAGVAATLILVFMPVVARERNSVLAAAALAYFCGVHAKPWPARSASLFRPPKRAKEFLVALLFTTGTILPVASRVHFSADSVPLLLALWIPAIYFTSLAFLNCCCIAQWEAGLTQDSPLLRSGIFAAALLLAFSGLLLALVCLGIASHSAALLAAGAASALLLAMLHLARDHFTPLALRAAADLVLITPLLLLL